MDLYAKIEISTLTDTGQRHKYIGITGTPPNEKTDIPDVSHKNWKWVPIVVEADPPFDDATQKLVDADDVITIDDLTKSKEVVALTQVELDSKAEREADESDREAIKAFAIAIRDESGTAAQWKTRVSKAVFRLLKDNYGS